MKHEPGSKSLIFWEAHDRITSIDTASIRRWMKSPFTILVFRSLKMMSRMTNVYERWLSWLDELKKKISHRYLRVNFIQKFTKKVHIDKQFERKSNRQRRFVDIKITEMKTILCSKLFSEKSRTFDFFLHEAFIFSNYSRLHRYVLECLFCCIYVSVP